MNWTPRISILEEMLKSLRRAIDDILARLARVETNLQQIPGGGLGDGGGGGNAFWAVADGAAHVATGTWPGLTPDSFTSDVYKNVGGAMTLVTSSATVYWWYKDAMNTTAGTLVPCFANGDDTYDANIQSCSSVVT